ncbi:MvaI/BcnI family restriction endonuclease [Sphingomonas sp. Leaf343]|uniref:MvaI/BcnI family restriction endonuclease n=1 Tax=Sphingomonas sp. Leaf343 TaxID=1736345 RepID=UPI0006FB7D16|nr:MvaI/BcnI family restriction endonuclease [Sphingomonas sp. Leaf343]KQR84828.1 hypothetical protein ASG07_16610 [Sphingomonas sp. Leaf343]
MLRITTLDQLATLFRGQGVRTAYVKHLSAKQDNSKNQIYLGSGLDGVTNLFPATIIARSASESTNKRKSAAGTPKVEAKLDFAWLGANGDRRPAPHTRIIDYFQYPEVRMSGFLRDSDGPQSLVRDRQAEYGRRILVMGTAADDTVVGVVLTGRDDPLVADFPELPLAGRGGVLRTLVIGGAPDASPATLIHEQMSSVVKGGWYSSRINRGGNIQQFTGAQGGGYTLEALLGVAANGKKAPDLHGYEIKSYSGHRISLMTPTPDRGFQGTHPFRAFMEKWGREGDKADGSRRFTGMYRCGSVNDRTRLELVVRGYDRTSGTFADATAVSVDLVHADTGETAAGWSLEKLANCWNAKHANALYIAVEKRDGHEGAEYAFGPDWLIGQGTDVWRLLRAIDSGLVFYDPADTIYADGKPKVRSQWRINARDLPKAMAVLYAASHTAAADATALPYVPSSTATVEMQPMLL